MIKCMGMEINKQSPVPLYEQVKQILADRIATGTYPPEGKIPSEKQLCSELNVSRPTVRQAVQELMAESLLYIKKGRGTFVREQKQPTVIPDFSPFTFSFLQADSLVDDTLLHIRKLEPDTWSPEVVPSESPLPAEESKSLNETAIRASQQQPLAGPHWELTRLKSVDRLPYAFIRAYIPVAMFPLLKEQLEAGLDMLTIMANKYPFLPHRSTLKFKLATAENDVSMYLNCSPGEPLFDLSGRLFARAGGLCEFYQALVRTDLIHFEWGKDLR